MNTQKMTTLCCQRVCGVCAGSDCRQKWLRKDCWLCFWDLVGWTIQNCQILVSLCFNQKTKFWKKASKYSFSKRQYCICLKWKMKFRDSSRHSDRRSWKSTARNRQPIECNFCESADDVPDPKEISPEHTNLMIFDDLLFSKTKQMWSILCSRSSLKLSHWSHTVSSKPCHGAWTPAPLSAHPSIECRCTAPQIEAPIYTLRTTIHLFIWQQQHTCGALSRSPMECRVGGQPHKTPHFHSRHRYPPTRNVPPKKSLGPA